MKNYMLLMVSVVFLSVFLTSCAGSGHTKYRGNPNTPLANIQPLQVDPNVLHGMSPQQRIEYLEYVSAYNRYARDVAYTNGYTAYNEKQWVNDEEGGPPSPPADYGQSHAQGRRSSPRKQPTIVGEAQKRAVYETKRVIDNSMRTTSQEISKGVREIIRDVFN